MEELKCNGKWTNCDPLPLAFLTRVKIKICSSLTQKPVFDITPTLFEPDQSSSTFLAYLSSEDNSIPSHYDGCEKMGIETNHGKAIRTNVEKSVIHRLQHFGVKETLKTNVYFRFQNELSLLYIAL